MPVITDSSGKLYRQISYAKEAEFERAVVASADQIFGSSSIYINVKKKMKGNDIVSIPDGYVMDMAEEDSPKFFVIENEISRHDPFRHIGIQLLRFATSFEDSQRDIRRFIMEEISKDSESLTRLKKGCEGSSKRNIDNYLDSAIYGPLRALVIIDEAKIELHQVLQRIAANISVLEFRTFEADDGSRLHQFDTLYDEFEEEYPEKEKSVENRLRRRARRLRSDTIIVPARDQGFHRTFLGKDQWHEIKIGAAMKERIRFIAAYRVKPVSAVTHLAEVKDIRLYKDTGKYVVIFRGPAKEINPVPLKDPKKAPQGPIYVQRDDLLKAKSLDGLLSLN